MTVETVVVVAWGAEGPEVQGGEVTVMMEVAGQVTAAVVKVAWVATDCMYITDTCMLIS